MNKVVDGPTLHGYAVSAPPERAADPRRVHAARDTLRRCKSTPKHWKYRIALFLTIACLNATGEPLTLAEKLLNAGGARRIHERLVQSELADMGQGFRRDYGKALEEHHFESAARRAAAGRILQRNFNEFMKSAEAYAAQHLAWDDSVRKVYAPPMSHALSAQEMEAALSFYATAAGLSVARYAPLQPIEMRGSFEDAHRGNLRAFYREQLRARVKRIGEELKRECATEC